MIATYTVYDSRGVKLASLGTLPAALQTLDQFFSRWRVCSRRLDWIVRDVDNGNLIGIIVRR